MGIKVSFGSLGPRDQLVEVSALDGDLLGQPPEFRRQSLSTLLRAATALHRVPQPVEHLLMVLLRMRADMAPDAHLVRRIVQRHASLIKELLELGSPRATTVAGFGPLVILPRYVERDFARLASAPAPQLRAVPVSVPPMG
jgi:hypothetical protein